MDAHTLGLAFDVLVPESAGPDFATDMLEDTDMLEEVGAVVQYPTFFHIDQRQGNGTYIDMSHAEVPTSDETCENFEFSEVEMIQWVRIGADESGPVALVALVGEDIYMYRIRAILPNGLLDKERIFGGSEHTGGRLSDVLP